MTPDPPPLPADWVLAERFQVKRVLGRGGFGIAYLCHDRMRNDQVVVKELAPIGTHRREDGVLELESDGGAGHPLRHRFLAEAEVLRRFHHPGIPALRAAFSENGTAYHVTAYLPRARTLDERLRKEGPLSEEDAREVFVSLLDVLEVVHAAGVLHRDIKPSNVLLGPDGEVILIDFGSARDWVAEVAVTHTVMHTPGYAPPEQMSEKALRGPGTDLYGLCATIYHALAGKPPATGNDRLAGVSLVPLTALRPELDEAFARTIEAGLEPRLTDRPADVDAMRDMLRDDEADDDDLESLERVDEILCRLATFRFDRRACPHCDGLLVEPKPLRKGQCPVCVEGVIRRRELNEQRCPVCRIGHLERLDNSEIPAICPICHFGRTTVRRKGLISPLRIVDCEACGAHFEVSGSTMVIQNAAETSMSVFEWREASGRSDAVWCCSACDAQLDVLSDGRWRQMRPTPGLNSTLYPHEWARIAAGLSPGAGNAQCDACSADYWMEDERITLLDAPRDPDRFAARYLGRPIGIEDIRWLGVGKTSGAPGCVCEACHTEFDRDGEFLRLVTSPNRRVTAHLGEPRVLEDWHRIAQDLPTIDQFADFEESIEPMLRDAYLSGAISFDANGSTWRGKAQRGEATGTLTVTDDEVTFGGAFRKWRVPVDAILAVGFEEDVLILQVSGEPDPIEFEVLPVELTAHLRSGSRVFEVTAEDLAARMSA